MRTNLLHQYQSTVAEGAASGTPGGLVGPNEWNAGHQLYLDVNAQSGTSYTIAASDDGSLVTFNNASPVAVTLPQAQGGAASIGSVLGFYKGWFCLVTNSGAGDVTITPTTSTVDGASSLILHQGQSGILFSDGTNYRTFRGKLDLSGDAVMVNGTLATSNDGTRLTVAVKTRAGGDPSTADPVLFIFRDVNATTGDYMVRVVTSALSINTNAAGATLGTVSNVDFRLWVAAFDNAGTVVLALFQSVSGGATPTAIAALPASGIASTTGISGSATAPGTFYTPNGTSLTNKAYVLLGYIEFSNGGLGTAGTYNVNGTKTQLFGPGIKLPGDVVQIKAAQDSTVETTSSTTYVASSNGQISITPTNTINLVKAMWFGFGSNDTSSDAIVARWSTGAVNSSNLFGSESVGGGSSSGFVITPLNLLGLDAPRTASAQVYAVQFKASGGGTASIANNGRVTQMILEEIMV